MLFKDKICSKCQNHFEPTYEACPNCGEHNEDIKEHTLGKGYINIKWIYQLACFLIGTLILVLNVFVVQLLVKEIIQDEKSMMITDFIAYGMTFCCFIPIIILNAKTIFKKFNILTPYLVGIGIAVAVILFSYANTAIINLLNLENTTNNNEVTSRLIIDNYPILSILILGIIGPICEELTYRLGLFSLVNRVNRVLAYIFASLVFALMHMDFSENANIVVELLNLPSYIFAGAAFAFAYDKFSLPCSLTAHIANNLYAIIIEIIVSHLK